MTTLKIIVPVCPNAFTGKSHTCIFKFPVICRLLTNYWRDANSSFFSNYFCGNTLNRILSWIGISSTLKINYLETSDH